MAQLMPLPLTVSCFGKIQIGFAFLVPAHLGSPGQRAVKRARARARVCVCVCVVAMIICNWCLVKALRRSSAMQRRCCRIASNASTRVTLADNDGIDSIRNRSDSLFVGPNTLRTPTTAGHRITPTLVALIVLFIVLVGPSEILTFVMTQQVTSYITSFKKIISMIITAV